MSHDIKVAVIDDQELVRAGLRTVLASAPDLHVVAEAANGHQAVAVARQRPELDLMLLDIRMPGLDGLTALPQILRERPDLPVLMLTTFPDDEYVTAALAAGASGFLLKRSSGADLISAVRAGAAGEAVLSPGVTRAVIRRSTRPGPAGAELPAGVTARELDVLRKVTAGANNGEIAQQLHLSESTVKSHVSRVMQKLGCRDRVQLALLGLRLGLDQH
ncbi:response regulator transcription factor [Kineosporia sp. NBRC 101731]|uniref:response regulator n=1 Tax=Kineosporia sp. NBRC 101731 TaxID=3032199 RepID=UPI0024A52BB9|nr:response regulator transcription factor [Kineosporia sp. NBRC 101731]GLY29678.1 DNA-binding response regulator [Kineosporia sp. NBRC 101731]